LITPLLAPGSQYSFEMQRPSRNNGRRSSGLLYGVSGFDVHCSGGTGGDGSAHSMQTTSCGLKGPF
jgi:hypothetical protein